MNSGYTIQNEMKKRRFVNRRHNIETSTHFPTDRKPAQIVAITKVAFKL